jgi:NAD dependent epimerase/dehydratase family enzyme
VAPQAVTNREFTKTLAKLLHRPAIIPVPLFILKLAPGRMAQEAILASARVVPQRLQQLGYTFQDPELEPALRRTLSTNEK